MRCTGMEPKTENIFITIMILVLDYYNLLYVVNIHVTSCINYGRNVYSLIFFDIVISPVN